MKKQPCIVCGKKKNVILYELPHGTLSLCSSGNCRDKLLLTTDGAIPIVWVGKDDYTDNELLTKAEIDACPEGLIDAAHDAMDWLWEGYSFGDTFHEVIEKSVTAFERTRIERTPVKELPLLLGSVKDEKNREYLSSRLKGG